MLKASDFLSCPNLAALPRIRHGFFTRRGGVSGGIYASLNCGPGSGDALPSVSENRNRVAQTIGGKLLTCHQIHSNKVVRVESPWPDDARPQADAMVTQIPGIILGILTADCVPLLFADSKAGIIGAAHAGWKGAYDGVIEATIDAMHKLGARDIIATIGPAIGQQSYEVGAEFYERFTGQDAANRRFFADSLKTKSHHLFDLKGYCGLRLKNAGIGQINTLANDTCFEEDSFFSFRRSTLRKEPSYGRQISTIMLAG